MNGFIVRTFPDAGFLFDVKGQRSLFTEGTAAQLLSLFTKEPRAPVPDTYLRDIPDEYREEALRDAEFLRAETMAFIKGEKSSGEPMGERFGTAETPFQKLVAYSIKNWQVVNAAIEVSYRCNLNCKWCYLADHSPRCLTRDRLANLADQLYEEGVVFVMFTGGETLLRPDIFEIMSDYNDRGFALEVKTNGILMNEKAIEKLKELNVYGLQVSIYGFENGYSNLIGAHYDFEALKKNIRMAADAGLPVGLSVLAGTHNIDQLDRYHEELQGLGVDEIFYSPYITPNRRGLGEESKLRLSKKEMDEKLYPFLSRIDGLIKPVKYRERCADGPICFAGRDQLAIDPFGFVYPCLDFRLPLGNLYQQDLSEILAVREAMLSPYKLSAMKKCFSCTIAEYCDSCPGTALLESGDFNTPSHHKCDVTQFYFRANPIEEGGVR